MDAFGGSYQFTIFNTNECVDNCSTYYINEDDIKTCLENNDTYCQGFNQSIDTQNYIIVKDS